MNSIMKNQNIGDIKNLFNSYKANPVQFLLQRKLNIPDNLQGDPQGIIQHLLNTGQMSQAQLNQLQSMVNNFKR